MKPFLIIVLIALAAITLWNTMEFWFYSGDVNRLRKEVDEIHDQIDVLKGNKHPAIEPPPVTDVTPPHPPPLDYTPAPTEPPTIVPPRTEKKPEPPVYQDNWGWCRSLSLC